MVVPSFGVLVCVFMYIQLPNNYEKHIKHDDKTGFCHHLNYCEGVRDKSKIFLKHQQMSDSNFSVSSVSCSSLVDPLLPSGHQLFPPSKVIY